MTTPTTTHDLAIARAERDAWQSTCEELHRTIAGRDVEIEAHLGRCEAADQRARSLDAALTAEREQLAAIRDLVAPGNPQETVVDAVRARLDAVENAQAFGIRERDAAIARAEKAESDLSDLTAARDRLLAREHEDGRLHAQLRAEIAELRARPVLTVDLLRGALDAHGHAALARKLFAHLGPVTLPSPDRLATLESHLRDIHSGADDAEAKEAWLYCAELINAEARALAKLSPDPAPTFDAAFLRRVMAATKHGPGGRGNPGPCDAACVKCEAERMVKAAPAREVAPTLVAVSDEDERSRTGQVSEPERSEWIGAAVAVADALGGSLGPVSGTSGTIDPREWIHFAAGLADRAKKLTARMAELEARPVLTVEAFTEAYIKTKHGGKAWPGEEADRRGLTAQFRATFAALGPVTLPSPDRAEELTAAIYGDSFSELRVADRLSMVRRTKDALAKLTPAPARPATAAKGGES